MQARYNYECQHCGTRFKTERRFLDHRCKQMAKEEEIKTVIGQAAWSYYQKWLKQQRKLVQNSQSFLHSKFYKTFIRFARFVKQTRIPDIDLYIWLMVERDLPPTIWTNDQVYGMYTEFLDHKTPAVKLAGITINTILEYAERLEIEPGTFFDNISANEVIQLIRQRKLSPWILLNSRKFKQFYINKMTDEQRVITESIIRPKFWAEKFAKHKRDVKTMETFTNEINL